MNNLYQQLNNIGLPNGITMDELRNPKQAVMKRMGNVSDPKQAIQQMLNSGQVSQAQVNQAMQMAQQFKGIIR